MNQLPILVPASKLSKSPSNVRKSSDAAADAQLEANIAARGIIQNLIGLPVARKKGQFRITAGGRRLDAVHRLIEKGIFDADYPVPVLIITAANDAIEISLSENFFKLNMNPADACRAFQDIIETEGKTAADVAKRFGITERFVLGRLRLAGLADPVFEALGDGSITLDVAIAYASTADTSRQAAVFEQLAHSYDSDNPGEIRRRLAAGLYRGSDPKALFVGRDAYVAAGGRIDNDLFSDGASENWIDGDILDQLADEKISAAAEIIREREGFAQVRAVPAVRVPYTEIYGLRPVLGEVPPLTPEEEARCEEIETEVETIDANADENEGYSEKEQARIEALQAELTRINHRLPVLADAQKTTALAYVVIGHDGQPRIHEQIFVAPETSIEEELDEDAGDESGTDGGAVADATSVAETGRPAISQRLADELATMKTELLAVHVASDPHFAIDLGTFLMVDAETRRFGTSDLATELRANAPTPRVHNFESGTAAAEQWVKLDHALDRSWTDHQTVEDRYDAFCALSEGVRAAWFGWAIARTLHAVPVGQTGSAFLDHLGRKLAIDVAAWWRPTARNYFDRISKPLILDLFAEIGGAELRSRYGASKKHDLAASAEKLFAGQMIAETDVKERALEWLPEAMRFGAPVQPDLEDEAFDEDLSADGASDRRTVNDSGDDEMVGAGDGESGLDTSEPEGLSEAA